MQQYSKTFLHIVICIIYMSITSSSFSQTKTIEERLSDLEKKMQALEAKLGITQTTSKQSNQPTEQEVKDAITVSFKKEVPPRFAGSLVGGKNGILELIEIKQWGVFNEQARYWPVKCRVKGTCDADFLFESKKTSFDKIDDFKIRQDDYGKWIAEMEFIK